MGWAGAVRIRERGVDHGYIQTQDIDIISKRVQQVNNMYQNGAFETQVTAAVVTVVI